MPGQDSNAMMARLIDRSYLEIVPVPGIEDRLDALAPGAYVAVTCSPTKGVEQTLQLVELLAPRQLQLVPHVAARMVRDRVHLQDVLQRLEQLGISSLFVPGGDAAEPLGTYRDALQLLRAMAELGHGFEDVGIAAHPEGHPKAGEAQLLQALLDKQPFATYLVTQMCFDAASIIGWLRGLRAAGVTLPAWVGLPGVADHARLFNLSVRIGVGQSAKLLLRQKGMLRKMIGLKPYQPDDLLDGLAPHLGERDIDIPGFHLFSFNDIDRTERWRRATLARYRRAA
jgi:methylenetetrahydrofolate reductase (NADPH)